jgi:hypothetical protein
MPTRLIFEGNARDAFLEVDGIAKRIPIASARAANYAANKERVRSARQVKQQINFSARYLSGADGKIQQRKKATPIDPEATLEARSRPTQLARFALGSNPRRRGGVKVMVSPGDVRTLPGAFFIKLRGGGGDLTNMGLAVRSSSAPRGAYKPKRLGTNLWLLYGPSVAQALINRDGKGVWVEDEGDILADMDQEFFRQLKLDR